jgi:hypothetical protein
MEVEAKDGAPPHPAGLLVRRGSHARWSLNAMKRARGTFEILVENFVMPIVWMTVGALAAGWLCR